MLNFIAHTTLNKRTLYARYIECAKKKESAVLPSFIMMAILLVSCFEIGVEGEMCIVIDEFDI